MLTLDQARSKMLEQISFPTQIEYLNLQEAANRICAEDIISPINVPLSITQQWMVMLYVYRIYNNL